MIVHVATEALIDKLEGIRRPPNVNTAAVYGEGPGTVAGATSCQRGTDVGVSPRDWVPELWRDFRLETRL